MEENALSKKKCDKIYAAKCYTLTTFYTCFFFFLPFYLTVFYCVSFAVVIRFRSQYGLRSGIRRMVITIPRSCTHTHSLSHACVR